MTHDAEFTLWYRRCHPRLRAALVALSGEADAALDAADEACARAWERWDRVRGLDAPEGWLFQTGLNVLRRRLRRSRVERALLRRYPTGAAAVHDASALLVWHVVRDLPRRQREAVVLRHLGGLNDREIAEVMAVARGTVSATLHAAYRSLRLSLARDEELT
jgi:RNA polymerase sigma-70 factor (ECF subfamily)